MKKLIPIILSVILFSCAKNNCQTCTMYVVGPDPMNLSKVKRDTVYSNRQYCGDELKQQQAENNKFTEQKIGTVTYHWTTVVVCK